MELFGKEYNTNEIDFIGIAAIDVVNPEYFLVISTNNNTELIRSTRTHKQKEISSLLLQVKQKFITLNNFLPLSGALPLINVNRAKKISLKNDVYNPSKNYLEICMPSGKTYLTEPEESGKNRLNRWEYYHKCFWSKQTDRCITK